MSPSWTSPHGLYGFHVIFGLRDMGPEEKRFVADVMLGRLAKWLRIIGYDTLYFRDIDDNQLIRTATQEGRILLTCDIELCGRGGFEGLLVEQGDLQAQLAQVIREAHLRPRGEAGIRCPLCNELLKEATRAEVKGLVPLYVWNTQRQFSRCPRCGKIFWKGTHWERIKKRLRTMGMDIPAVNP